MSMCSTEMFVQLYAVVSHYMYLIKKHTLHTRSLPILISEHRPKARQSLHCFTLQRDETKVLNFGWRSFSPLKFCDAIESSFSVVP